MSRISRWKIIIIAIKARKTQLRTFNSDLVRLD